MYRMVGALVLAVAMVAVPVAGAEDKAADVTDLQSLRNGVRTDERAYVASLMKLTDAEAKRFWPIYDAYQRDVEMADRRRTRVLEDIIGSDRPISDIYAKNMLRELLLADEIKVKARRTMTTKLIRALPPRKAARYVQLDAKIRAVTDYDIAGAIPLVQ